MLPPEPGNGSSSRRRWRGHWIWPGVVLLVAAGAFGGLLGGVRGRDALAAYDPAVTSDAVALRTPLLTLPAHAFTYLGGTPSITSLVLVLLAWTGLRRRNWPLAGILAGSMILSVLLTIGMKHLVERHRPPATLVLGAVETGFSFPSGHTLNSTVFFGLVAGVALTRVRSRAGRAGVVLAWLGVSAAVGLSRIYLGYHWMTDVLGGFVIGVGVLAVTLIAARVLLPTREPGTARGSGAAARPSTGATP